MTRHRRIYLLSPQDLSPETIAVTFAKTSRSPKSFDEIAAELTDASSARFHEKWVVGYGHASVAEHAVLHLALENVSRLAVETIEGNRLASYTEKSTRYQEWEEDAFHIPKELDAGSLRGDFIDICTLLFKAYRDCIPIVKSYLSDLLMKEDEESQNAFQRRIHSAAVDVARFLLPAASLANVGVTINARSLEYAICKMLSSPLIEVREIGTRLREVAELETPTLVKYAQCNAYLMGAGQKVNAFSEKVGRKNIGGKIKLVDWDKAGQEKILAAILFRYGKGICFQDCLEYVSQLSEAGKGKLTAEIMSDRSKFDQPLREFEYAALTFEALMDQGAYFEFKRHRMMTQTVPRLSVDLGFAIPKAINDSGCSNEYCNAMQEARDIFHALESGYYDAASYIVPNGFNRRVLFTLNLREAFHFCRLRAAHNAHFSIRMIAQNIAEIIRDIYPHFGYYLDVPAGETSQQIEESYFTSLDA